MKKFKTKLKNILLRSYLKFDDLRYRNKKEISLDERDMAISVDGHLQIQGCDVVKLCEKYGTPLHIVDRKRLFKNYNTFLNTFQANYSNVNIYYSYKTNPLPAVLSMLHSFGAGAEVISSFELWLALKLGVSPDKIIYNGPAKEKESLRTAVTSKIKLINIDGPNEIKHLDDLCRNNGYYSKVGLRVVTSIGWQGQFGFRINADEAIEGFKQLKRIKNLHPCAIHFHLGTGLKSVNYYTQAVQEILEFAKKLKMDLNIDITYFDIGGGFGVRTVQNYSDLDTKLMANDLPPTKGNHNDCPALSEFSRSITNLFKNYYSGKSTELPTIIFEPGRAITSDAQSLILKIVAVKPKRDGKTIIISDGGKNIAMPTSWQKHQVFCANKITLKKNEIYAIYGPLCHPHDLLFPYTFLPLLSEGDYLAIMDAGAYFIPNQINFSFPRSAAILVEDGNHRIIRERETFDNMVSLDRFSLSTGRDNFLDNDRN